MNQDREFQEKIATALVDAAYKIHRELGPGLLEKIYEKCLFYELKKRNLKVESQVNVPIVYDGLVFNEGLRLDLLINDEIICEIKASDNAHPVWEAQIISQLRLAKKPLGFLINFNVPRIKEGIKRFRI